MAQDGPRVCLDLPAAQRRYCGHKGGEATVELGRVTCRDCGAALRADQHAGALSPELDAAAITC